MSNKSKLIIGIVSVAVVVAVVIVIIFVSNQNRSREDLRTFVTTSETEMVERWLKSLSDCGISTKHEKSPESIDGYYLVNEGYWQISIRDKGSSGDLDLKKKNLSTDQINCVSQKLLAVDATAGNQEFGMQSVVEFDYSYSFYWNNEFFPED